MRRYFALITLAALAATSLGQRWQSAYEAGLEALRQGQWQAARQAFKVASAERDGDVAAPTSTGGSILERKTWRGGAPYSPNFLATYSGLKAAAAMPMDDGRTALLKDVAAELEALHSRGQASKESFYFLNSAYVLLGDTENRIKLEEEFARNGARARFRVDSEAILPEDLAALKPAPPVQQAPPVVVVQPEVKPDVVVVTPPTGNTATVTEIPPREIATNPQQVQPAGAPDFAPVRQVQTQQVESRPSDPRVVLASAVAPTTGTTFPSPAPLVGRVPALDNKFALVIGTSETLLSTQEPIRFAADDAQQIRDALVTHAGYPESNVDLVLNASAQQIIASAQALAERVPEGGTVFIYFSGPGVNLDGKDFLAGIDTEISTDVTTMVAKNDLYRMFMAKGARIYAFYQVHRPTQYGRYFGSEVPMVGSIAQVQATLPNANVYSFSRNGRDVGLFTNALTSVMADMRSNRIPVLEFGWQVFNKIRRGDTGTTGGSSRQTPTLPVLTNMASDARF